MALKREKDVNSLGIFDLTGASDIIFTLLLFYILTQSFLPELKLELPKLTGKSTQVKTTEIKISEKGQISIKGKKIELTEIANELKVLKKDSLKPLSIMILADKNSPAGISLQLLDKLQQIGLTKVSFQGLPLSEK